jgi:hypothetical protein
MKKLILLAAGAAVLYQVAKYYKITSVQDIKKLVSRV